MTSIEINIFHPMTSLQMVFPVILTFIFKVKYFWTVHLLYKIAQAPDVSGRFASTNTAPTRSCSCLPLAYLFPFNGFHYLLLCYGDGIQHAELVIFLTLDIKLLCIKVTKNEIGCWFSVCQDKLISCSSISLRSPVIGQSSECWVAWRNATSCRRCDSLKSSRSKVKWYIRRHARYSLSYRSMRTTYSNVRFDGKNLKLCWEKLFSEAGIRLVNPLTAVGR